MSGIFDQTEIDAAAATSVAEPQQDQEQQEQQGQPRDEHGRFAPKQGEEQQDEQQQPEEGQEKRGKVDHGAFHKEREQRKAAEAELKKVREQLESIAALRAQLQAQPKPADPAQNADDPVAALKGQVDQLSGTIRQQQTQQQQAQIDDYETRTLIQAATTAEAEFKQRQPDYDAALNHLVQARAQELQFYGLDPLSIQETIRQEALEMTRAAVQLGRSPAELAYQVAQSRGYRPQQQQQQQNGAATVDAIIAAQKAGKSLGAASGAGSAGVSDLNAQTLANMSLEEFDRLYATPEGRRMIDSLS